MHCHDVIADEIADVVEYGRKPAVVEQDGVVLKVLEFRDRRTIAIRLRVGDVAHHRHEVDLYEAHGDLFESIAIRFEAFGIDETRYHDEAVLLVELALFAREKSVVDRVAKVFR